MFNYTRKSINKIALFVAIIIFIILESFIKPIQAKPVEEETPQVTEIMEVATSPEPSEEPEYDWYIEIPKINLIAPISEGTDMETLNQFVGHFEETKKENGNVGLAAHNRGYPQNYFQDLKSLEINDEVFYKYNGIKKKYKIERNVIIKDTNWHYLENTKEDKITMITCVENKPELRRCLQATYVEGVS